LTLLPIYAIIIILIKDINIYNKYINYISLSKDKDQYSYNIYKIINILFKEKESFTLDELESFFFSQFPALKNEQVETYSNIFKTIREQEISDDMLMDLIRAIEARSKAEAIGMMAFDVSEGKKPPEALYPLMEDFGSYKVDQEDEDDDDLFVPTLSGILERRATQPGLRWRLKTLNRMMGSLRKGNYGIIIARSETGKTTLLASEITHMAEQTTEDRPVLWFNNEEERDAVGIRIIQGALGLTKEQYSSDPEGHDKEYVRRIGKRLYLIDDASLTRAKVERIIKKMNPILVVFDQVGKMQGFDNDRDDLRLGAIHQWAREIAKKYCATIGVAQADGTAEGVKWLNQGHVANAKTAIQAECDWILGVGKTHKEEEEFMRFFHLSKNKLTGDADTEEPLRHGRIATLIEPTIARYRDLE